MIDKVPPAVKVPWFPWIGKRRPFYGWVIVFIGNVTSFAQGITSQGYGTYLRYLQKDFGWTRALLAGPRSAMQVENAILGPLEGFLMDRLGPRVMASVGITILALGLILFGFIQSLWTFFAVEILIALGGGLQGILVMSVAINHWFRRKRTIAQSLAFLGFTMAGVAGIPALVYLQTTLGWRMASILSGVILLAVGLPCAQLLRRSPEPYGLSTDGDPPDAKAPSLAMGQQGVEEYDFTLRQALRTRAFWLLSVGQAIGGLGMGAVQVHLFLHLEEGVGLARTTAALVWTVASMTNVPFRILGGVIGDRLPKNLIMGAATAIMGLSILILGLASSLPMAMTYAVLYGIGWGARTPVMNAIQGDYFGRKSQGVIRGWLQLLSLPLTIAAPVLAGYLADTQGNYRTAFTGMAFVTLAGSVLLFMATRPKPPTGRLT